MFSTASRTAPEYFLSVEFEKMSNKSNQNRTEILVRYIAVQKFYNVEAIPLSLIDIAFSISVSLFVVLIIRVANKEN